MKSKKRILAVVLAVFILSVLFLSYGYIIENTNHDCTHDEHCPICLQLKSSVQLISTFKFIPALSFFITLLCVLTQLYVKFKPSFCIKNTLITLKVELLN